MLTRAMAIPVLLRSAHHMHSLNWVEDDKDYVLLHMQW
jgi:hypothetical protein